jgi:hypothetical protein
MANPWMEIETKSYTNAGCVACNKFNDQQRNKKIPLNVNIQK